MAKQDQNRAIKLVHVTDDERNHLEVFLEFLHLAVQHHVQGLTPPHQMCCSVTLFPFLFHLELKMTSLLAADFSEKTRSMYWTDTKAGINANVMLISKLIMMATTTINNKTQIKNISIISYKSRLDEILIRRVS